MIASNITSSTGTISAQTINATSNINLNGININTIYATRNNPTFTGTVSGITSSMVGLGNCNNTSDLNKPISTATQNALNLLAPLASPTFTGTLTANNLSILGTIVTPSITVSSSLLLNGMNVSNYLSQISNLQAYTNNLNSLIYTDTQEMGGLLTTQLTCNNYLIIGNKDSSNVFQEYAAFSNGLTSLNGKVACYNDTDVYGNFTVHTNTRTP